MARAGREYRRATWFLELYDCDEYIRRQPIKSLHSLEAEFAELCRDEHQTTAKAAAKAEAQIAKVEARIKAICDLANFPDVLSFDERRLTFGEHFVRLLRNRFRSSADAAEYGLTHDHLLLRLSEVSAEKQKLALEEAKLQHAAFIAGRDRQMAKEFLQKRNSPSNKYISDSSSKAAIGKSHGLRSRSAAIEAVNRGRKALKTLNSPLRTSSIPSNNKNRPVQ